MTTAQADAALVEAQILLATITELRERIEAGAFDDDVRAELATDLFTGAAAMAKLGSEVAA
jgi:hypothetical protein